MKKTWCLTIKTAQKKNSLSKSQFKQHKNFELESGLLFVGGTST